MSDETTRLIEPIAWQYMHCTGTISIYKKRDKSLADQGFIETPLYPSMPEADETIARQTAEIERLREALDPFAREGDEWPRDLPDTRIPDIKDIQDDGFCSAKFSLGDLRRARQALTKEPS